MDETTSTHAAEESVGYGGIHTTALFLSLYLLVLAFFIVLVSISSLEEVKSKAVMNSLTSTFSSLLPTTDLNVFSSREGQILAGKAFQEQITSIFATDIQVAKVEVLQPGRLMQVTMDSDSLFQPGTTDIREAQVPLLDRVVANLSANTPGLRYDLEFIIGSPYATDHNLPITETLETDRAGAFARAILARGAPPSNIAVGIEPGDAGKIVLRFFSRTENEVKLQFEAAEKKGAQPPGQAP